MCAAASSIGRNADAQRRAARVSRRRTKGGRETPRIGTGAPAPIERCGRRHRADRPVALYGRDGTVDGSGVVSGTAMRPTSVRYGRPTPGFSWTQQYAAPQSLSRLTDFTGEGREDLNEVRRTAASGGETNNCAAR